MKFNPVWTPTDSEAALSIHDDPPGLWSRVVVLGVWQDARITRKRWPSASVVGPLRTQPGIDLLVRNLLNNPQIRLVLIDGPTAGVVGEETLDALHAVFRAIEPATMRWAIGEDVPWEAFDTLTDEVRLLDMRGGWQLSPSVDGSPSFVRDESHGPWVIQEVTDSDRSCGAIRLPPPPPKASAPAPHGDPGERVVGETLADVWPRALQTTMRFGREVPTQYGMTKEFLNLVSVVRDPALSLQEILDCYAQDIGLPDDGPFPHPILGLTYNAVDKYCHDQLIGSVVPEGQSYGYGSRMTGGSLYVEKHREDINPGYASYLEAVAPPNQFAAVKALLAKSPETRAAYLTPWRADEDSGKEQNRPCLVGVMFRATPGWTVGMDKVGEVARLRDAGADLKDTKTTVDARLENGQATLHMAITFRSHDLHGAYPLNLAGCCLWLTEWARDLGMAVGTLTCHSHSAHVYDRNWAAAEKVIAAIKHPPIRWDSRSSWRIEKIDSQESIAVACQRCASPAVCIEAASYTFCCDVHGPGESGPWEVVPAPVGIQTPQFTFFHARRWVGSEAYAAIVFEPLSNGWDPRSNWRVMSRGFSEVPATTGSGRTVAEAKGEADAALERFSRRDPLPFRPALRATGFMPGPDSDGKVIAVLEADTPGNLRLQLERSGFVTEIGAALYLGTEIARVWGAT